MARHRSPRGRSTHLRPWLPAETPAVGAGGVHRAAPVPFAIRHGAVAATVAGGALVLAGPVAAFQATSASGSIVQRLGSTTTTTPDPPTGHAADPLEIVGTLADELPQPVDAAALAKAAGLAESPAEPAAQPPEQPADKPAPPPSCKPNSAGFGAVKPWVATAGYELRCTFGVATILGVGSRGGMSDHPLGLALDFMANRSTGDALAGYVLANMDRLGVKYVIWKQRINYGSGWQAMEDRGSATANHFDHVHVSFNPR